MLQWKTKFAPIMALAVLMVIASDAGKFLPPGLNFTW
jgi:hypothetical protein